MNELQFNGVHLAIVMAGMMLGFFFGAIFGYFLREDHDRETREGGEE